MLMIVGGEENDKFWIPRLPLYTEWRNLILPQAQAK